MLGRLRLRAADLRGRRYPERTHPYRNEFQRDRDRIVHSRAFRRLEGKTQVFAAGFGDHFRNRLTHTIEVAQIARTIASALELNDEYTEALALAHDLGHPPFGHSGEKELDRQMRQFGSDFEHNSHALRIVDLLEERYARFDGLNLTHEVREGVYKHSRELHATDDPELIDLMPGLRPPLEAQLLDAADEIAYSTADLDDAFSATLLSVDEIANAVPVFAEFTEQIDTQFPGATPRVRFWEVQRELVGFLANGLIEGTREKAEAARVQSVQDLRSLDHRIASFTPESETLIKQLKALLVKYVYSNEWLAEERAAAVVKVGALFQFLLHHPEHISAGYQLHLEHTPLQRVICDYIAGMTDAFFMRTYETLVSRN